MPYRCDDICPTDAFLRLDPDNHAPFGDTIVELSGRAGFKPNERLETAEWSPPTSFGMPHREPLRKIGRNDPCPCDSGKKFEKCCLNAASWAIQLVL
jgi:hypothetical protein